MKRERIIFDNQSSRPLYEVVGLAFDAYFENWEDNLRDFAVTWKDLKFFITKNKASIRIIIQDL
jgi:hypothetical protein